MVKMPKTLRSFAEQRRLIQLAASGKSLETIVRIIERPPETVLRMAARLGVSVKAKPKG
jgi:hypothetical protein